MALQEFSPNIRALIPWAQDDRRRRCETFPILRASLVAALGLLPTIASRGQEALRSALSADAAINSQTNAAVAPQPDNLRLGPVLLNLGTYLGVTYDDNINASQDHALDDFSIHEGISLGFNWPATLNSQIQFASQFGYATYLKKTRSDSIEITPDSALTWGLSFEDGNLTFYDQFDYSQEVITVPSVAGINSLPRFENTIGTRAQWSPGKWQWEAGISHNDFRSTDAAFGYLDRGSEYIFLRGARRFGEGTQAGLEFSASQTNYRLNMQSDNTSFSLGPYANWTVTKFMTLNISGGPTIYRFDATGPTQPASTLTLYYFDFELAHQLTEFVSHQLSARRDVSLGYNKGNQYTELFSATYAVSWAATRNASLELSLTYENGNQPLTLPSTKIENFDRIGIAAGLSYRITEKFGGGLHFAHWERASNISGNNYGEDNITCQLNYRF